MLETLFLYVHPKETTFLVPNLILASCVTLSYIYFGFHYIREFLGGLLISDHLGPIPGAAPLRLLGLPQKRRMVISVNPREILGLMHSTLVPPNSVTSNLWFWAIRAKIFFDK